MGDFSQADFRKVMGKFASGVTVVTTEVSGVIHGMTANAFISVSLDPSLVLISVDKRAKTHGYIQETGTFGISILSEEQQTLSNLFAQSSTPDASAGIRYERLNDVPVLADTVATIACELWASYDGGDHTLFVGLVTSLAHSDKNPLLYFGSQYHTLH
ncbi:flavin oxidoreductase [Alicyclobacillus acidoterrestris]|uniref:flavin reductase family protein n=1 Tax=Alicyclobacillus suci TaxID=2816080 RepID=UPI0011910D14|nr:flavin reductase family protein [Alicyclobacillus suci]GEO27238.1 flavin oxidoreductase [Alicyclobacillus acidoterrestris]